MLKWLANLSIKTKIILSIISSVLLTVGIVLWFLLNIQLERAEEDFKNRSIAITNQIANRIYENEKIIDLHLLSSLKGIYLELEHSNLNYQVLNELKEKYYVSDIFILSHNGKLDFVTDKKLIENPEYREEFSFFEFCPAERDILGTRNIFKSSPIIWLEDVAFPSKFVWTYHHLKKVILEVTYNFEHFKKLLESSANVHKEIMSISINTPQAKYLSFYSKPTYESKHKPIEKPEYDGTIIQDHPNHITIVSSFGEVYKDRCEVFESNYYYNLQINFDKSSLIDNLFGQIIMIVSIILTSGIFLVMILSLQMSKIVSGIILLNDKISAFSAKVSGIYPQKKYSGDEISKLNSSYNDLITSFENANVRIIESLGREQKLHVEAALGQQAHKVGHDILSPLVTIKLAFKPAKNLLPEDTRVIISNSIQRIEDIANYLRSRYRKKSDKISAQLILDLLERVISEKRIQYPNIQIIKDINEHSFSSFSLVNYVQFERAISNLINNSIDAIKDILDAKILISLKVKNDKLYIELKDNGKGIPENILEKIRSREQSSYGKQNGTGLGLVCPCRYHS